MVRRSPRRYALIAAVLVVLIPSIGAVYAPFLLTRTTTAGTLYNDATKNIFDSYDPKCDPATASANGIIFCAGFEDRSFTGASQGALTDYWGVTSDNGTSCTGCNATTNASDQDDDVDSSTFTNYDTGTAKNSDFTVCNTGTVDPSVANFAASGTPCAMTEGWGRDIGPIHCMRAVGGNPMACQALGSTSATRVRHAYVRGYFKWAGVTSERCPSGTPCPAVNFTGGGSTNGVKHIEFPNVFSMGGLGFMGQGTQGATSSSWISTIGITGDTAHCTSGDNTAIPQNIDGYLYPNQGNSLSLVTSRDHWIFFEIHWNYHGANNLDYEWWLADCGTDGKQCTSANYPSGPLHMFSATGIKATVYEDGGNAACALPTVFWANGWTNSPAYEGQFDEIVIRDGDVLDSPIGFAPIYTP